jgi:subtilisin family serine protease
MHSSISLRLLAVLVPFLGDVSVAQEPLGLVPGTVLSPGGIVHVEGRLLVGWEAAADPNTVEESLIAAGAFVSRRNARLRLMFVQLPESWSAADTRGHFAQLPGVSYCDLDAVGTGGMIIAPPNDTHFPAQWHLDNTGSNLGSPGSDVEALGAWKIETGDPSVVLAILDTGIDFGNPEFSGRVAAGFDFVNNDSDPSADHPHGIWVTALAAAETNNAFGIAGLDQGCTVLPVKVLNSSNAGTVTWLVNGLDYCALQEVDVVSMSLINYPASGAISAALQACRDAGCILVACAGNGGSGNADVSWPGAHPDTISIGATNSVDGLASFSGTGAALDFVAPGKSTVTLENNGSDGTDFFSGCSAATPLAAATVTLCKALDPTLTHQGAYERLLAGAEDRVGGTKDKVGRDDSYGWGRINARRSLDPLATRYCAPAISNSTGTWAVVTCNGSPVAQDNQLSLTVSRLPTKQPGYFLGSMSQGLVFAPPGTEGALCLGGPISRFVAQLKSSGSTGSFVVTIDLSAVPLHGAVQAGQSWNFQCWYRDMNPNATSNFSDAVTILFE